MNKEQELRLHGPFKTDDFASYIYGSNDKIGGDNPVLEIRGWGYLTGNGHGALGLGHAEAVAEQKRFASFVVDALNAASPPAVAAGGVTAEGIVAALVATEFHRSQIQGFYAKDAGTHYIRDCTKPHDQQRIWSARSNEGSDYDLMHARMMERIELERWRIVLAALAVGHEGIREGWQPIETAPKDGTYILAFPVLLNVASVVVWEPPAETPPLMLVKGDHVAHDGHWRLPMSQLASPYAPTHWQPLPTPPSRGEGV